MSDLRIHAALSPRVAVLSSPDVDRVVQLNGIPDLPTLLRPFEFSVERLSVRTSQLETRICDQFPLRFDPYALFNPDAARAISLSRSQAAPRPSAVGRSHEELLDRVNHLIASNIKRWDAQVPRTVSSNWQSQQPEKREEDEHREEDQRQALDETLIKLQRGSLEEIAPWFAAVQQLVFGQRTIAKHESFGHPVAVLLAVSSASPDPMNDFAKLYEASSQASPFPAHPYINPDTLKYYVLIHDTRTSGEDLAGSKEILEQIKKTYGLHCCLLAINSASDERAAAPAELAALWSPYLPSTPTSPVMASPSTPSVDPTVAKLLDLEDVKRIKGFIRELTAQSIVPFMERYVQHMGEHLANSRKGLTNRFFGASRKLFGGVTVGGSSADKSGSSAPTGLATSGGYDPQHEFYPPTSIEAQTRRLADFAFTIRDYKLAASMYDLGRKDFAGDKASRHAAGATEMFGLSHLMIMYTSRSAPIDVDSYLAQACYEYDSRSSSRAAHNPASVEENHALRATLLYYEAYRMLGYLRPVPAGLLRMSQRSEEVLAPLLLEQAALSCLQMRPKPSLRKFALYLVTAAHRYQACGQKILSLRCYAHAAVVYRAKGWALIENHIEHELGMQAYNEGDSDAAVAHLVRLIRPSANSSVEHERFLQDVRTAYKYSGRADGVGKEEEGKVLALPFAMFDVASAALRFVPESSASATSTVDDAVWETLEQDLVDHGLGERTLAGGTKKRRKRPTGQTSTQARQVPINQTFWLDVEVRNPLDIGLAIDEIRPLLSVGESSTQSDAQDLPDSDFETDDAGRITLAPFQSRRVQVALRVKTEIKTLRVASITFRLEDTIHFNQRLDKKGQRLNKTKEQRTSVVYAPDLSLAVSVHGARPTLTAKIVDVPVQMYCGEEVRLKVVLKNEGEGEVEDLRALCDQPEAAAFVVNSTAGGGDGELTMPDHLGPAAPQYIIDTDGQKSLSPAEEYEATLVVRPVRTGELRLAWLLSFSSADGETYLSRMALHTSVSAALQINVSTRPTRDAKCEHEVWVEASNMLSTEEIRLEGITVLSPSWKIVGEEAEEEVAIAPLQVWRGRVRIAFDPKGGRGEEYTATKLQDLLLSRDVRRPPPADTTIHRSTHRFSSAAPSHPVETSIHIEARKLFRQRTLSLAFPTIASRDRTACFTLFPARSLDVIISFSAQSSRKGSIPVYDLNPGPGRSVIRGITHPSTVKEGTQVRSLYAETLREKASMMQNIVSGLGREDDPVVVGVEVKREKVEFTVRNFSDVYEVQVEIQCEGEGWVGRRTRRCRLLPGGMERLYGVWRGSVEEVRYTVVSESYIGGGGTDKGGERVLVGRWVERY